MEFVTIQLQHLLQLIRFHKQLFLTQVLHIVLPELQQLLKPDKQEELIVLQPD